MGLRYEAWTLPWSGDLVRTVAQLPVPEGSGRGAKVFVSTAGEGSIELNPDQFARVGDVISDTVGSLIRVYDGAVLIDEWLAERNGRSHDDTRREFSIGGPTMPGSMDKFFVPAFDYPVNPSRLSDWIYDGESSLSDGGFESANVNNETYQIDLDGATGGSFVLHLDGDSTASIAWNASESTVAGQIETLTGIIEVLVTAGGERYTIEFFNPISPENEGLGLLTWTPSLTGGDGDETLIRTNTGLISPSGTWTTSQYADASNDPTKHGTYASDGFRLTEGAEPVHSGTYAARINGLSQFAGIQQLVQVEPNARYQASIWFYSSDATETFRLVMRDRYDTLIEWVNVTNATPNTWTQVNLDFMTELPDGTGVDEIIFRFAQTQNHNPSPFYVDDAMLQLGAPAATPGEITSDLHAAMSELAWLDISSFSDTNDSSSVAWTASHSFVASWGETFGQVLDKFVDLGYEWDIVAKATPTGTPNVDQKTHDLVIYNQGNMDNAPSVAINVGQGVTGGEVVKRIPSYTSVLVEGADGLFSEAEDSGAVASFGTLKKFFSARHLADQTSLDQQAAQLLISEAANRTAVQFNLVASDDHARPLVDYIPGDTVPMQLPPLLPKEDRRVQRIDYINTFPTQYTVTGSRVMRGEAAAMELVRRLWRRFSRPEREYRSGGVHVAGKGGAPTIVIAAVDSTEISKAKADFICDGADYDHLLIQTAISMMPNGGRLLLCEGNFYCSWPSDGTSVILANSQEVLIQGLGPNATFINISGEPVTEGQALITILYGQVRDLSLQLTGVGS